MKEPSTPMLSNFPFSICLLAFEEHPICIYNDVEGHCNDNRSHESNEFLFVWFEISPSILMRDLIWSPSEGGCDN